MCARIFERFVLTMQSWSRIFGVVRTLLQFCGILVIRETMQTVEVLSETYYCGTVNVLDAADTDWDSNYRVNKSQFAR